MADISLLVEACIAGQRQPSELEKAVQAGVNINSFNGTSPVMLAVQAKRPDIVSTLVRLRADPNIPDAKGVCPLHMAVFDGAPEIIQCLILSKADVNKVDRVGQTPLFFAPHGAACEQLGRVRCDPNVRNLKGQTALHLAAHAGLNETVLWLAKNMSRDAINAQDEEGRTAVWCAALANLKPTIALLQEHGADVTLRPHKVNQAKTSTPTKGKPQTPTKGRNESSYVSTGSTSHRSTGRNTTSNEMFTSTSARQTNQEQQRREWRDVQPAPLQTPQKQRSQRNDGWLTTPTGQGMSFESISPKRDTQELRHLQDESPNQDQDVLAVLQTTLKEPSVNNSMSLSAPHSQRGSARGEGWISSAPLFANAPKQPLQALPEVYSNVSESTDAFLKGNSPKKDTNVVTSGWLDQSSPEQPPKQSKQPSSAELLPFATYYKANVAPSPAGYLARLYNSGFKKKCEPVYKDLPDPKVMEGAIRKIQNIQRGRVERTRAQMNRKKIAVPVNADDMNGAAVWEIALTKRDNKSKYGFWHDNAKVELAKEYAKALQMSAGDDAPVDLELLSPEQRPEALIIKRIVKKGLLEEWNFVHPEAEVRPGDRIIKVNASTTIMGMQKELRTASITCKVLRPPEVFSTSLDKSGSSRKLGFKFEKPANSDVLRITEIVKDGLLDEVNRKHMADGCHHLVVMPGMRIEAANDITQDCSRILDMIKKNDSLKLQIRRSPMAKSTEYIKSAPPPRLGS